jgi:cytochrome c-type biogenesis protein CcmE
MSAEVSPASLPGKKHHFRVNKFIIGGVVISVAVLLLAISNLRGNAQYYMTINELIIAPEKWNQNVRISGAVRGDSIQVNPQTGYLTFVAVNVPGDMKTVEQMRGIAAVLHQAVIDPNAASLTIRYHGARPDLLKNEAQAIITGKMQPDGTFLADDLLLKCPSKYEAAP